jgi:hypothetical protein
MRKRKNILTTIDKEQNYLNHKIQETSDCAYILSVYDKLVKHDAMKQFESAYRTIKINPKNKNITFFEYMINAINEMSIDEE